MPDLGSPSLAPETSNNVLFQEVQRAWDVWFYKLLCAILVVAMMAIGTVCWRHHAPVTAMIMFGIGAGWYWMFASMALFTEVRKDALYVRLRSFHLSYREIAYQDVMSYEARTYKPIREYGGWGIKFGPRGWAYNLYGNRGVELQLQKRANLMIGSQQAEELASALGMAMNASK